MGEEWWTAYQPVSYRVESRLGTREQYAAMVQTCHDAGVDVWADAVINHMTGQDDARHRLGGLVVHALRVPRASGPTPTSTTAG